MNEEIKLAFAKLVTVEDAKMILAQIMDKLDYAMIGGKKEKIEYWKQQLVFFLSLYSLKK